MSLAFLRRLPPYLRQRWHSPAGYREVLVLAGPLVLSTGTMTVQQFINRMFLTWYSPEAMAAALPGGALSFTILCFFIGLVSFTSTFVAQYHGSGQPARIPVALWQAIYLSLIAAVLVVPFAALAGPIFHWAGHPEEIRGLEVAYFRILLLGGGFSILSSAVSTFFIGLGRTRVVMWVNVSMALINIVLDYALIFGGHGLPRLGICGAAWATVISSCLGALTFLSLFLWGKLGRQYASWTRRGLDRDLMRRLLRFGAPSGLHFMLDILAWSLFILMVGRLGVVALGVTNMAFQINSLIFMPMLGFSIATATLVGQRLGENSPDLAERSTWSAFHLTFSYMTLMAILYVLIPQVFIAPFAAGANPAEFEPMRGQVAFILRFVAAFSLFDSMNLIFSGALKGAGDTLFVMLMSTVLSVTLMVAPTWYICHDGQGRLWLAWLSLTLYVCVLALCFLARFLNGRWRSMRVTEMAHEPLSPTYPLPGTPPVDGEIV